jgi:hypothetical protein
VPWSVDTSDAALECKGADSNQGSDESKFIIYVTVIGCNNLKSPLKRVITRPINAMVLIGVGDESHYTDIIQNNSNPRFGPHNSFIFAVPPSSSAEGFVECTVSHKGVFDNEIIGVVRIPFAALSLQRDTSQPSLIRLPLTCRTANVHAIGKGFQLMGLSKQEANVGKEQGASKTDLQDSNGFNFPAEDYPTLDLKILKVNARQFYQS